MTAKKKAATPKSIAIALGYDSFRFGDTTHVRESAAVARVELDVAVAKAKRKKIAIVDETLARDARFGALEKHGALMQLDWSAGKVRRAWFTGEEEDRGIRASELIDLALQNALFSEVEEIGVGMERWSSSHQVSFDAVVEVLAARKAKLKGFAVGDTINENGHILKLNDVQRVADTWPDLERLRITCTQMPTVPSGAFSGLRELWVYGNWFDEGALTSLARPWPRLERLGIGYRRAKLDEEKAEVWAFLANAASFPMLRSLTVSGAEHWQALLAGLVASPLFSSLERLELRTQAEPDRELTSAIIEHLDALKRVPKLVLPEGYGWLGDRGLAAEYRRDTSLPKHRD